MPPKSISYCFISDDDGRPDGEVARQQFKELCGSFQAALSLGPCVLLIDGVDELGASLGLSPQEVSIVFPLVQTIHRLIVSVRCLDDLIQYKWI